MALVIPLVTGGVAAFVAAVRSDVSSRFAEQSRRIGIVEGLVSGHSISIAETLEHVDAHEKDAAREIARIDRCEQKIDKLSTDASARPDPWTGTDGRQSRAIILAVERRVDELERLPDKFSWLKAHVDEIEISCDETRKYYQDNVIPLIQRATEAQIESRKGKGR